MELVGMLNKGRIFELRIICSNSNSELQPSIFGFNLHSVDLRSEAPLLCSLRHWEAICLLPDQAHAFTCHWHRAPTLVCMPLPPPTGPPGAHCRRRLDCGISLCYNPDRQWLSRPAGVALSEQRYSTRQSVWGESVWLSSGLSASIVLDSTN